MMNEAGRRWGDFCVLSHTRSTSRTTYVVTEVQSRCQTYATRAKVCAVITLRAEVSDAMNPFSHDFKRQLHATVRSSTTASVSASLTPVLRTRLGPELRPAGTKQSLYPTTSPQGAIP